MSFDAFLYNKYNVLPPSSSEPSTEGSEGCSGTVAAPGPVGHGPCSGQGWEPSPAWTEVVLTAVQTEQLAFVWESRHNLQESPGFVRSGISVSPETMTF